MTIKYGKGKPKYLYHVTYLFKNAVEDLYAVVWHKKGTRMVYDNVRIDNLIRVYHNKRTVNRLKEAEDGHM